MISQLKKVTLVISIIMLIVCTILFDMDLEKKVQKVLLNPHESYWYKPLDGLDFVYSVSKDLTVHEAYFDGRSRDGYTNVTVLLITVHRDILESGGIVGCGTNVVVASNFSIYSVFQNKLMHDWLGPKPVKYESQLVFCYNLPVQNGSKVFTLHKKLNTSTLIYLTYSRQDVFLPQPRLAPRKGDKFTVIVCANADNKEVPWFKEFIRYQKTVCVDHIDFSILDIFIKQDGYNDLVLNNPSVRKALGDGFISFRVWRETYENNDEVFFHSAILRKLGCIYRHLGTYDYAMPLDTDDFFVPRGKAKKLKDYIDKHCHNKFAGSCKFDRMRYHVEHGLKGAIGPDGNVTAQVNDTTHTEIGNYKSAHYTKAIIDASFHDAQCNTCLMPGYVVASVPQTEAYVAHLRSGDTSKKRTRN